MKFLLLILSFISLITWSAFRIDAGINFGLNIENYISQASSSPNPQIAVQCLDKAISEIQRENLTSGNTGVFFHYPSYDIAFWYQRLVDSRKILVNLSVNDSPLEVSNTMMRVHESLTEQGKDGSEVRTPDGISIYPNNVMFFWWCLLSWVGIIGGIIQIITSSDW